MLERLPLKFADAFLLRVPAFADERGVFKENYVRTKYEALGLSDNFVQDNVSVSRRGVLRGLHGDSRMSKLVSVISGEVFDVIVDARRDSPTFAQWQGVHLRATENMQLYIPAGFLHGFVTLSAEAIFFYKQSAEYAPDYENRVRWNDEDLAIGWPMHEALIISPQDQASRAFRDVF